MQDEPPLDEWPRDHLGVIRVEASWRRGELAASPSRGITADDDLADDIAREVAEEAGRKAGREPQRKTARKPTKKRVIGLMSGLTSGCLKASKRLVGKIIPESPSLENRCEGNTRNDREMTGGLADEGPAQHTAENAPRWPEMNASRRDMRDRPSRCRGRSRRSLINC